MRNLFGLAAMAAAALAGAPAHAAVLGPDAAACARSGPAMLVEVEGFRTRTGLLRVQSYGGNPAGWFDKGTYLRRVEVPVPASGKVAVCLPVPHSGTYAVSVRHDPSGSGRSERSDGGGLSGNPHLSLFDAMLKRKPDPSEVAVTVRGVTAVPIVLNYVQGLSLGPVARDGS